MNLQQQYDIGVINADSMMLRFHDRVNNRLYPNYNKRLDVIQELKKIKRDRKSEKRRQVNAVIRRYNELQQYSREELQKISVKAQARWSKGQTYLYGSASSKRRYYGKDWSDFDRMLWEEAQMDVYGDKWVFKGLSPTEKRTFDFISHGLVKIKTRGVMESEDHKRLVKYYAKKLDMTYEHYRRYKMTFVGDKLTTTQIKNILRSANKTFKKYSLFPRKSYTKLGIAEPINIMSSEERELVLLINRYRKRKLRLSEM
jgi:hypothetical protein